MKRLKKSLMLLAVPLILSGCSTEIDSTSSVTLSDTSQVTLAGDGSVVTSGQDLDYDEDGSTITPAEGDDFYGQDADYTSDAFSFTTWNDTTIDNNTGLMWQSVPSDDKFSWDEGTEYCEDLELDGYSDWRLPSAEELFSISDFETGWPYLDTEYFSFPAETEMSGPGGDGGPQGKVNVASTEETESVSKDQGQFWTSNFYKVTEDGAATNVAFGVNHATGHIKAYPASETGIMAKHVRAVRGEVYGDSSYVDNGDGTITDQTSNLMWMSDDLGSTMEWFEALSEAENTTYAEYSDWRLPDVKELQSIVNYDGSYPAIDQTNFNCTEYDDNVNYYFWTNTSAYFSSQDPVYGYAWYVAFGFAIGDDGLDSHGAGAVRFSPKYTGSPNAGEGGDNITNSVRLVRNIA